MKDYASLDFRSLAQFSGVMAAGLAGDSEIFQFRWANANNVAKVLAVTLSAGNDGTAFAAGTARFALDKVNTWSSDGSGGTAATLTGRNGKLDGSVNTIAIPTTRVSSTAALTAGTKTIEASIGGVTTSTPNTAGGILLPDTVLFSDAVAGGRTVTLNNQEGLIIRANVPATGTWRFVVTIVWAVI